MNFDEWWAKQPKGDPTEPITLRMAWEAAVTATRKTCEVACSQALEYAKGAEREACAKVFEAKANALGERADLCDDDEDAIEFKARAWQMTIVAAELRERSNAQGNKPPSRADD